MKSAITVLTLAALDRAAFGCVAVVATFESLPACATLMFLPRHRPF
jgi:hypothetical protein